MIFDVDVKGGLHLKKYFGDNALAIFVKVPSMQELEKRLRERGTENEDSISKRVFKMKFEMEFQEKFDIVLLNDDLEISQAKAKELYENFTAETLDLSKKPLHI